MSARRTAIDDGRPKHARGQRALKSPVLVNGETNFPIVAIGASAGGLDAFRTVLTGLSAKSGMAFVLVQHLDPSHESKMVELLSASTAMPVFEAREGVRLEPNSVCVIPPGHFISVRDGTLHLTRPAVVRMPFDFLLRSLAEAVGQRAVCVILSGTASDGSEGARAIKGAGGLVIVQEPEEAEYDGMPLSAIATGAVDLVLPLAKIPGSLAKYAGRPFVKTRKPGAAFPMIEGAAKIIDLVRKKTSHDFALYKTGTLVRRIERRMAMSGIRDSSQYLELLARDPAELQHLAEDLLINVTCFFRDPKVFELLKEKIVPELVRTQPPQRPIRIWVAGCSTGEEAYSIAMLLLEEFATAQRALKLQIFATDIDEDAVTFAREGLYPAAIEADVPPEQLKRFFTKESTGYRVTRELRATIAFSVHDLMADAPFSRLDLISCRNLLIYLRPDAQKKVLGLFHFALRDGGVLVLGTSETVGDASDRFEPVATKQRIYRHTGPSKPGEVEIPIGRGEFMRSLWPRAVRPAAAPAVGINELAAQRVLLETYAPASVLIDRKHQALYFFGPVDRYLKMPEGVASFDVLASAREGLRPAIRTVLEKTSRGRGQTAAIAERVKRDGRRVTVTVAARPVKRDGQEQVLLSFVDAPARKQKVEAARKPPVNTSRLAQVELELDITRKELETAIRDRETAEEELRAINEEAMSVNEEFQTTNEELETSKEELQSLNEELMALNSQLQETVGEYQSVANDFENILNSSQVATLFLDDKLNIRFFTPAAKNLFSVITSDVGRPLADLARHFTDGNLFNDARAVLTNLVPVTHEVAGEKGAWYTCRIMPYRTKENRIEGVVITFIDVTERKIAEDAMNAAKELAEKANLGKSRFLAAASHDLRQPLQSLGLLQELLATKIRDEDLLKLVELGQEAVTAMSGILNTLLNINQLEAGVIRPEVVDFPINEILEPLRSEFAYHTQNRGLDWRVLPCRLTVHSDPRLIEQMIRNLLSNAMKYTKTGGILLGCRRRGGKLRVQVWDTGVGIPKEQIGRIFEEFHQIDNPAHEMGRGLGLGLAIVQRLGDLLGYTVDVRSRVGRGSVFSIDVPLASESRPVPRKIVREPKDIKARAGQILVIDDDPALRKSLQMFLRTVGGHQTMAAANGEEAIRLVERQGARPDVTIVDYNLPGGMTGLEVLAELRRTTGHNLPALVLTGDMSTETLGEISRQGYIHRSKPVDGHDLTSLIQSLLPKNP